MKKCLFPLLALCLAVTASAQFPGWGPQSKVVTDSIYSEFFQTMRNNGIPLQFRVRDGGHTGEYWHSALYTCLPFVTRCFGKAD